MAMISGVARFIFAFYRFVAAILSEKMYQRSQTRLKSPIVIETFAAGPQKVSALLEVSKPAPQTVLNYQ